MWTVKVKTGEDSFETIEIPTTPRLVSFLGCLAPDTEVSVSGHAVFKMDKWWKMSRPFENGEVISKHESDSRSADPTHIEVYQDATYEAKTTTASSGASNIKEFGHPGFFDANNRSNEIHGHGPNHEDL